MYSPFYIADQRMLYSHRVKAKTVTEIQDRLIQLVVQEIVTIDYLENMPIGKILLNFFPCADQWTLLDALRKPIYVNTIGDISDILINK
jgi:hypothetical protein